MDLVITKVSLEVFCIFILFLKPWEASPLTSCRDGLEYTNGVCCSKCPAGKRQVSPCSQPGEAGTCEECDDGTFTEHANVLNHCFKCTRCRTDQEVVRQCTPTRDGECQCKAGRFCAPDQACEVCKKCLRCEDDEELVRNCTSTSNTECKKRKPDPPPASGNALGIVVVPIALGLLLVLGVVVFIRRKRQRLRESAMNSHDGWKPGNPDSDDCPDDDDRSNGETQRLSCLNVAMPWHLVRAPCPTGAGDERKALRHSPGSSASNSQRSLTGFPSPAFPAPPPRAVPTARVQPDRREEEEFPRLVAVNGESLSNCLEYFADVPFQLYKRFFRHLGVADNAILSKDHLPYEDRIHDLLIIWVEKAGRGATLNDLLTALLSLNQRWTAETIKEKAILHGHYKVEA